MRCAPAGPTYPTLPRAWRGNVIRFPGTGTPPRRALLPAFEGRRTLVVEAAALFDSVAQEHDLDRRILDRLVRVLEAGAQGENPLGMQVARRHMAETFRQVGARLHPA